MRHGTDVSTSFFRRFAATRKPVSGRLAQKSGAKVAIFSQLTKFFPLNQSFVTRMHPFLRVFQQFQAQNVGKVEKNY